MKKISFFVLSILLLLTGVSNSQSKFTQTVSIYPTMSQAVQQQELTIPSGFTYSGQTTTWSTSVTNMGMLSDNVNLKVTKNSNGVDTTISVVRKTIHRTIYAFPLTSFKYTSTNHLNITNVIIHYSTTGYTYTFKITQPNSYPGDYQTIFSTVGSSSAKQTGITYSGTSVNPASGLSIPIKTNIPTGIIYFGVLSESESTSGSTAQMGAGFYLEVTYERDNEARTVTAQNDMHGFVGGQIYWDGGLVSSPQFPSLHEGETHTFGVYSPQNYIDNGQNYEVIWHLGTTNTSYWKKDVNGTPSILGSSTSVSYTTTWNEVGTITHTAYMRRKCNVTFTGAGGTITIDSGPQSFPQTRTIIEGNPITATASNYSGGGLTYTFLNGWTSSDGQSFSTTINPWKHDTYTANYSIAISGSSITLQGDIIIPAGQSFNISSGVTVELNNHSIISNGGTITLDGSAVIRNGGYNNFVVSKNGSSVQGIFPNFQTALNNSSSNQTIELNGSLSFSGNIVIQSGCTIRVNSGSSLTVAAGSNLSFNPDATLEVYGTLNTNGSSSRITFDLAGSSGTWGGINFYPEF